MRRAECKRHLNPGGVIAQWVPLYESDTDTVKSQIAKDVPSEILMAIIWGSFRALIQGGCDGHITLDDKTIAQAESCVWEAIRR